MRKIILTWYFFHVSYILDVYLTIAAGIMKVFLDISRMFPMAKFGWMILISNDVTWWNITNFYGVKKVHSKIDTRQVKKLKTDNSPVFPAYHLNTLVALVMFMSRQLKCGR